jgi:murein DD-endopeptidase MepM/ murein hydrolase activator NlpD
VRASINALIASFVAVLCAGAGVASAQTTTTDEPAEKERRPKPLRLRLESVAPQKVFFKGSRPATFKYEIAGTRPRDIVIEVVRKGRTEAVQRWHRKDVEPGRTHTQTWGGNKRPKGMARSGRYLFRVRERGGRLAERSKADGDRSFGYFDHVFPVRGKHGYGDGIGAPRKGHRHQGQDVFAKCGTRLEAARAGRVQHKAFQGGGAGYYVVIDGRRSSRDYVYMHLKGKADVSDGERVRTEEKIGEVGDSGSASGCHLHFELWSRPGWYEGGHFLNPTKKLKRWDRWS